MSNSPPIGLGNKLPDRPKRDEKSRSSEETTSAPKPALPKNKSNNSLNTLAAPSNTSSNQVPPPPRPPVNKAFMPTLPPRMTVPASGGPVLDPDEPPHLQKLRRDIHSIRVSLIRAAQRLGYDHETGLVKQVLYRLNLAEKLKAPWKSRVAGGKRPDPALAAAREATRLESQDEGTSSPHDLPGSSPGPSSHSLHHPSSNPGLAEGGRQAPLGFTVKMMLIGLTGAGKTQLVHSLLDSRGIASSPGSGSGISSTDRTPVPDPVIVDPIEGATKKVEVIEGVVHGIRVVCVDTPGLVASSSAVGRNSKVIQQIKRAYRKHRPDLVVYVDRIDSGVRAGAELPALQALTESLGSSMWLNTIFVLTHAGAEAPCENGTKASAGSPLQQLQLPFEAFAEQRSNILQQIIRGASGDSRLMNPTAYVDSHPHARTDERGASLIANGMPWKSHLYLMIVSAKLLADTESMLQSQDNPKVKQQQQLMMMEAAGTGLPPPRQLPLPYLVQSLAQFSRPLDYPDQGMVLEVRSLERLLSSGSSLLNPKDSREVLRQIKQRLMQIRQANANKERMQTSFRNSTLAGGKVTPEPPPIAAKRAASVHPPGTHRYRVPEPSGGWLVRPHIDAQSMEACDGIEGMYLEKSGVMGRRDVSTDAPPSANAPSGGGGSRKKQRKKSRGSSLVPPSTRDDIKALLGGAPFRHNLSCQVNKDSMALQAHSETTLYHDTLGSTTTTLSADIQTSASVRGPTSDPSGSSPFPSLDSLVTLRGDLRRQWGMTLGKSTLGLLASHMTEGESGWRVDKGPTALGIRVQHSVEGQMPGPLPPAALNLAAAAMSPVNALALRGGSMNVEPIFLSELCVGGNGELSMDLHDLFRLRRPFPVSLNANGVIYKGDLMTGLGASCHYESSPGEMVGGRLQVGGRGKQSLGVSLKVKSQERWWAGLIAMVVPLSILTKQSIENRFGIGVNG